MSHKSINDYQGENVDKKSFSSKILNLFTIAVLCGLPLVVTNAYFNILQTKYLFYCGTVIVMLVLVAGYGCLNGKLTEVVKTLNIVRVIKRLSIVDWAMIMFWFSNVMSWVFCVEWRHEAFWGTSGRFNGVFLMTLYMIVYFIVTRLFEFKKWYLDVFLAVGLFVCLFGITDYFQMNILGFKTLMIEKQKKDYTSTFGNINTYTVYVAAVMVVSTILFATENNRKKIIWYYLNMVVACFALIMGVSDNAYLSLSVLFGLSPLYLFKKKTGFSRYLMALATFFTVILCIDWINSAFAGVVLKIDSAFKIISSLRILPIVVVALWGVAIIVTCLFIKQKKGQSSDDMPKWLILGWYAVIAFVVGTVIFMFYDATIAGNSSRYGALAPYVTFNDKWGTNRGYVWKCALEIWNNKLSPIQKIFGYGSDTFRLIMFYYYSGNMVNGQMVVFDSVHNEYLNYLLTIGFVGMAAYIVFLISAIARMWRRMEGHPEIAATMFVVLAYMIQALININLPIVMPIILQLLSMGLSKVPTEKENK